MPLSSFHFAAQQPALIQRRLRSDFTVKFIVFTHRFVCLASTSTGTSLDHVVVMLSKRKTSFQSKHLTEFSLKIVQRDAATSLASAVECQLCVMAGREDYRAEPSSSSDTDDDGPILPANHSLKRRRRSKKTAPTLFTFPFRKELYERHHQREHRASWAEYKAMTVQQRVAFLNNKTRTISAFFPKTSNSIKFEVNSKIVEDVIGDMFWHPEGDVEEDDSDQDVELITKRNALKLFVKADDADPDVPYKIEIKNVLCFDLATAHTSIGLSFRQIARIIAQHRAICKNPLLSGISDYTVGQFVRIQVGINLQLMASILARKRVWAFSIACDGSTHRSTSFFDVHLRVGIAGKLYNLHLVILPFFERHSANNITKTVVKLLTSLYGC